MAYIGTIPTSGDFVLLDSITTSATASYTMQKNSVNFTPQSANHMIVSLNGTIQAPVSSFTVSGSTLTFASALTSSDVIDFILVLGNVNDVGTATTVVDSAITKNKTDFITDGSSAGVTVKGSGSDSGSIALNCSSNSHAIQLISPDHSAGQSYKLKMPDNNVTADKFIKVKSITGSGATATGQLEFADGASPYYVQLANVAISDGDSYAEAQNVFSSTYRNYLILFEGITVNTNSADLQLIFMKSDNSTPSEHTYAANGHFYGADNNWTGSNSSNVTIMQGQGSGAGKQVSGFINVFQPNFTTDGIQRYTWHVSVRRHDSNNGYVTGGGNNATNSARTGFRVKCNSGNLAGGRVVVYGITNPS